MLEIAHIYMFIRNKFCPLNVQILYPLMSSADAYAFNFFFSPGILKLGSVDTQGAASGSEETFGENLNDFCLILFHKYWL